MIVYRLEEYRLLIRWLKTLLDRIYALVLLNRGYGIKNIIDRIKNMIMWMYYIIKSDIYGGMKVFAYIQASGTG